MPVLLANPADRTRLLTLLDKLLGDPRIAAGKPTAAQRAMAKRIQEILRERPRRRRAAAKI